MLSPDGSLLAVAGPHDVRSSLLFSSMRLITLIACRTLISFPQSCFRANSHGEGDLRCSFLARLCTYFWISEIQTTDTIQLIIATTHSLLVYSLPKDDPPPSSKGKQKGKSKNKGSSEKVSTSALPLLNTVNVPSDTFGEGSTFRQIK